MHVDQMKPKSDFWEGTQVSANQDRLFIQEKPVNMHPSSAPLQVLCECHKVSRSIHFTVFQSKASHRHQD